MTSIPASRRHRATTFTPRSCPSSPTLASSTRMFASICSSIPLDTARRLCYVYCIRYFVCEMSYTSTITTGRCQVRNRQNSDFFLRNDESDRIIRMRNTKIEGIRPGPTLVDRAYAAILDAICDRRLPPGERINQEDLAAMLQISRQPVGQALTILKSQGFVRDNGRRGLIVAPLERTFFRSIYQLREAIDALAARLAAERCSPSDAIQGKRLIEEGRRAEASGSVEALIDADMALHMWIYTVAGNPLIVQTMNLYWNHLRRAMGEVLRDRSA